MANYDFGMTDQNFPIPVYECGCGSQTWFCYAEGCIVCTECGCETTVIRVERMDGVARKGILNA